MKRGLDNNVTGTFDSLPNYMLNVTDFFKSATTSLSSQTIFKLKNQKPFDVQRTCYLIFIPFVETPTLIPVVSLQIFKPRNNVPWSRGCQFQHSGQGVYFAFEEQKQEGGRESNLVPRYPFLLVTFSKEPREAETLDTDFLKTIWCPVPFGRAFPISKEE